MCYTNRYMYHYICSCDMEDTLYSFNCIIDQGRKKRLVLPSLSYGQEWCDHNYKFTYLAIIVKKKNLKISALLFGIGIIIQFSPLKNSLLVKLILITPSFYERAKRIIIYIKHAYYFSHFPFLQQGLRLIYDILLQKKKQQHQPSF